MDNGGGNNNRGRGGVSGWRGRSYYSRRWMYRKGGRGRGSGGQEGSDSDGSPQQRQPTGVSDRCQNRGNSGGGWKRYRHGNPSAPGVSETGSSDEPPPKKKKRTDAVNTIKSCVEAKWKRILPGYDLYYDDSPPQLEESEKKIAAIEALLNELGFASEKTVISCQTIREDGLGGECAWFSLNYDNVVSNKEFARKWKGFTTDLVDKPDETIKLWSATAHKLLYNKALAELSASDDSDMDKNSKIPIVTKIQCGFLKSDPVTPLINIKSGHIDKFITIKGAVVSAGSIRPMFARLTFKCRICEGKFAVVQPGGRYTTPSRCKASDDCRNSNAWTFEADDKAAGTIMVDSRRIKVQDFFHYDIDKGTIPKTIDCILLGTWAEHCNTGDLITLSGIVKSETIIGLSKHGRYIEVSSMLQQKDSERTMGGNLFTFSDKDLLAVKAIHDEINLFKLLVASLCPSIFGHDIVKAGLLLSLFGGTVGKEGLVSRRSDINMLMVGDPGIGKSQMLKVLCEVAPKAVYVCGTGTTVAGLTVTLVKDGDDYSLEGGALVMANKGICCIDEFDKMSSQHSALLEAMEQQSVSVAKAGVHRNLPARSTVIAAANPVGGHYNQCKTVTENIKINSAMLSRFDLIFILLDKPNNEFDQGLIAHKAALRMGRKHTTANVNGVGNPGRSQSSPISEPLRLCDKLRAVGEKMDLIPHGLLRKYIAYAKQYVHPKLTEEAIEVLKKFYLNMRLVRKNTDSTPVTPRQLESLVRLSQARAKLELREEVTAEDASDVIEIFDYSLASAFDDEVRATSALSDSVLLDTSICSGSSQKAKSLPAQAKQVLAALQKQSIQQSKNLFSVDELKSIIRALGYGERSEPIISALNNMGVLLNKGCRTYKLIVSDF